VEERLEALIPRKRLEKELERIEPLAEAPPAQIIQRASGWGALERLRREAAGEPPMSGPGLPFDDESLGPEQAPWLELLRCGTLPEEEPHSWMVQKEWCEMLEEAVRAGRCDHWVAWLHLAVMRCHAGDHAGARRALETSQVRRRTFWGLRNLAVLEKLADRMERTADLQVEACRLRPGLLPLAVESGRLLLEAGQAERWLALLGKLPQHVRRSPRIRLLEGRAALEAGQLEQVEDVLREVKTVQDLREGERSLTDLWFAYHEKRIAREEGVPVDEGLRRRVRREFPPPERLDFRMKTED
jgi:hypothetical protein